MDERGSSYEGNKPSGGDDQSQRRIALVIGNGAYSHAGRLANPTNDAASIERLLTRFGFEIIGGGTEGINLDYGGMAACIRNFARHLRQQSPDVALLFYAGHGLQVDGRNYLMPVDAALEEQSDVGSELFELQHVLNQMEHPSRTSLVILDACRNNPLVQNLAVAMGIDARDARLGEGLAEQRVAAGTLIAYATQPGHVAYDGRGSNGYLTEALLAELENAPERDVELLLRDVRVRVLNATRTLPRGAQVPWVHTSLLGPFAFRRDDTSISEPTTSTDFTHSPGPPGPSADDRLFAEVEEAGTCEAYRFYLAEFPHGLHAAVVRFRLQALERREAEDARAKEAELQRLAAEQAQREEADWGSAQDQDTIEAYGRYLEAWPAGAYLAQTKQRLVELEKAQEQERQAQVGAERYHGEGRIHLDVPIIHGAPQHVECGAWFKPGAGQAEWFKDFDFSPEMVVVPAGGFTMGSPADELWRDGTESPQPNVTIAEPFAVGRFAVTFDEWDAYVEQAPGSGGFLSTGQTKPHSPSDQGWGRGTRPVINVSWEDAQGYIAWLNSKLDGNPYRLLSETEWEYAARAGTTTPFWWGSSITPAQANYDGNYVYKGGGDKGECRGKTVPVDSFEPNPWGLYNAHGNVWEWTADCWNDSHSGNPGDGGARTTGHDSRRVVRGGSWSNFPQSLRSAYRFGLNTTFRYLIQGFRLARTLNP